MWQIKIHHLVIEEDFKKIDPARQKYLIKTIKRKLSLNPQAYGKPLRGEFFSYWRLAVGNYRVIYRILKEQIVVLVVKVGIRRDAEVYEQLFSRLKRI